VKNLPLTVPHPQSRRRSHRGAISHSQRSISIERQTAFTRGGVSSGNRTSRFGSENARGIAIVQRNIALESSRATTGRSASFAENTSIDFEASDRREGGRIGSAPENQPAGWPSRISISISLGDERQGRNYPLLSTPASTSVADVPRGIDPSPRPTAPRWPLVWQRGMSAGGG